MKKLVIVFMMMALLCLLAVPAAAATDEAIASANTLYNLGLFVGTGNDANGNPNFDLDRTPTRHEAVIMLVRLLGKEEEALAGTWTTPFTDVVYWAEPYVGYAYENGLTVGTGAATFGGYSEISVSQYLTFVLRALGYQNGVDFRWDRAWELSDKLGITNGQYNANTAFTRGDVAIISEKSLYVPEKGCAAYSEGLDYEVNTDGVTCTITGIGTCTDTEVIIPKFIDGYKVTYIGIGAFADCSSLTNVVIHDNVISIAEGAFCYCTNLTDIRIPDSVTFIGSSAFEGCSSLTNIEISDSVTSIGSAVFFGCSNLKSIELPDSVTSIGEYAFSGCSSLTSIQIPDSVTSISNFAFDGCSSLTSVEIPHGVTNILIAAFRGCIRLTSIEIPDSVTSIASRAFAGCSSLTDIEISDSVTSIGDSAFYACIGLTSVKIPDSVTRIDGGAFSGCSNLTSIEIPNSMTSIDGWMFYNCSSLTSIHFNGTKAQWAAMKKGGGWDSNTGNYTVYCTDGNITK